jgi:hypothetical protein
MPNGKRIWQLAVLDILCSVHDLIVPGFPNLANNANAVSFGHYRPGCHFADAEKIGDRDVSFASSFFVSELHSARHADSRRNRKIITDFGKTGHCKLDYEIL